MISHGRKFNDVPFLSLNGCPFSEVGPNRMVIFVGVGNEETDCFNVEEATLLRDWLNAALASSQPDASEKP